MRCSLISLCVSRPGTGKGLSRVFLTSFGTSFGPRSDLVRDQPSFVFF